jgi:hypothetical protein
MTILLDHRINSEPRDEADFFHDQPDSGKALYLMATRLVSRNGFQPNLSREVMTARQAYERPDVDWELLPLRRSSDDITSNRSATPLIADAPSRFNLSRPEGCFVVAAQKLADQGNVDSALDHIFDQADSLLLAGEFTALNEVIAGLDAERLSIDVLLAVLTISLPAKSKLPARSGFYCAVERLLRERGEFRDGLLSGLQ